MLALNLINRRHQKSKRGSEANVELLAMEGCMPSLFAGYTIFSPLLGVPKHTCTAGGQACTRTNVPSMAQDKEFYLSDNLDNCVIVQEMSKPAKSPE